MRDAVLDWQAMFVSGSASRVSFPSFAEGTLAGHVAAPTPRPWSITQPDDEEVDVEVDLVLPRRRSKGRLLAFAMLCGLVAYGALHPQDVRSVSDVVALRAAPLWRAAESKASAAITPPAAARAEQPPAPTVPQLLTPTVPPPPAVPPSIVAPPPSATPAATATTPAPKPVVAPVAPHAIVKPEKKAVPKGMEEQPTAGGEPDGIY
jgi:hypothetical protein